MTAFSVDAFESLSTFSWLNPIEKFEIAIPLAGLHRRSCFTVWNIMSNKKACVFSRENKQNSNS
jgi:hypothetical protein